MEQYFVYFLIIAGLVYEGIWWLVVTIATILETLRRGTK